MAYKGTPPKVTTEEYRQKLEFRKTPWKRPMCWEAVHAAFGVQVNAAHYHKPMKAAWIIDKLENYANVTALRINPRDFGPKMPETLATFIHDHQEGDYVIQTPGHVIAVRNGKITDTTGWTSTVRRRVLRAWQIVPAACTCADPAVFGHFTTCQRGQRAAANVKSAGS